MAHDKLLPDHIFLAYNNPLRIIQPDALQSAKPGRSDTDNQHSILLANLRNLSSPIPRGKYISDKQSLLIAHIIWNTGQPIIGKRHTNKLCLSTVNPTTECPTTIRIYAIVDPPMTAEETLAAERLHIHRNTVARLHRLDRLTNRLHDTDHLMPDSNSRHSSRHATMLDM